MAFLGRTWMSSAQQGLSTLAWLDSNPSQNSLVVSPFSPLPPSTCSLLHPWSLMLLMVCPALRQVPRGTHHKDNWEPLCTDFSWLYHGMCIPATSTASKYSVSSDPWDHYSPLGFHISGWSGKCPKEENCSECVAHFVFPVFQASNECYCPIPEKKFSTYYLPRFIVVFGERIIPIPLTPSWPKVEVQYSKHFYA